MKTQISLLHLAAFVIPLAIFSGCRNFDGLEAGQLERTWQLEETYDGYFNGGSFAWSEDETMRYQFNSEGTFASWRDTGAGFDSCSGTWELLADSTLRLFSSCNSTILTYKVTELRAKSLILDHDVIEGVIREKYYAD